MPTWIPATKITRMMAVWNQELSRSSRKCLTRWWWRWLPQHPKLG